MEKLIITVACDSRTSYPINHLCPPQEDIAGVAQQYIDGIKAGAAIAHIHGRRTLEESMQADGKQVSKIHHEGWKALQEAILEKSDIHIHIPAGAMPKDGPSAGVTMFTALVSMLTSIRVRHDVAMTGEITLRGRVLPIGGLKEKVLAAHRAGIKRVLVPERNKADLDEVPAEVKNDLEFVFVSKMEQVLEAALEEMPKPKPESVTQATPPTN